MEQMSFKIVPVKVVLDYLRKYELPQKESLRVKSVKRLLKYVEKGAWTPLFAFVNEFGEHYLVISDVLGQICWFGDESDWAEASSYYEDKFMNEYLDNHEFNIVKDVHEAEKVEIKFKEL